MKKSISFISGLLIILFTVSACFTVLSCNEGLFNFNDETGNISLSFTAESIGINLDRAVFTLSNDQSGDEIIREVSVETYDSNRQEAEVYISRVNVGNWNLSSAIFDYDNNLIAERQDSFELELGQTAIVELEYFSSGDFSSVFEKPAGAEPDSLIEIDSMDTLISGFHYEGLPLAETSFASIMIARGSGFDIGLSTIRAEYPDGGFVEYDGGWARAIGNVGVELDSSSMSLSRDGYYSPGTYTLILSDINDVETSVSDNCSFGFPADTGMAIFSGTSYTGTDIDFSMWEQNGAASAGTYIVYIVSASDGTQVAGVYPYVYEPSFYNSSADTLVVDYMSAGGYGNSYIVIATVDAVINQTELNDAVDTVFSNTGSYPDLQPEKLPGWLYITFGGERINYIGLSVAGYSFP